MLLSFEGSGVLFHFIFSFLCILLNISSFSSNSGWTLFPRILSRHQYDVKKLNAKLLPMNRIFQSLLGGFPLSREMIRFSEEYSPECICLMLVTTHLCL